MSCGPRILEGDLESGVTGLWRGGGVEWRGGGVEWRGGGGAAEWSDWTVEWSGGAAAGRCLACGVEYLVNSRLPVYHVNT